MFAKGPYRTYLSERAVYHAHDDDVVALKKKRIERFETRIKPGVQKLLDTLDRLLANCGKTPTKDQEKTKRDPIRIGN